MQELDLSGGDPRVNRFFLVTCVLWQFASAAAAHDSWLIADRHVVEDGDKIWLSFVTGAVFPIGERATDPQRVTEFVDVHKKHRTDVSGLLPQDKGLSVRGPISGSGLHVFVCELKARRIELDPVDFESYLRAERAGRALETWTARKDSATGAVEYYTKYAKTIVEVQPTGSEDTSYQTPVGHRLELIPLSNPCHWTSGTEVRVRVLVDGHPWPGISVSAGHEGQAEHDYAVETTSGTNGVATIPLSQPGHWFIKAHLIRPSSGVIKGRWESFWASLTFRAKGDADVSDMFRSIRRVHGDTRPAAVAGYRIGENILDIFKLKPGSRDLHVIVHTPLDLNYAGLADGIQAATGASIGKLNLAIREAPASRLQAVFVNLATGQSLRVHFTPAFLQVLAKPSGKGADSTGPRVATMPDDRVFVIDASPVTPEPVAGG